MTRDAQHQGVRRIVRLVDGVVDDDAVDLGGILGIAVDQLEERVTQVVEHPAEAGTGSLRHGPQHRPPSLAGFRV